MARAFQKLFSPRAKSAREGVKLRRGGNKKEEKHTFFQGFPEATKLKRRRTRKSPGRILRVVSLFIYSLRSATFSGPVQVRV